ncbi:MAG: formate/nitrite transporter family protein [Clostridiales bacterium]|nr:formate/nitrite transporter family protein [Clostridiales bacterium]MDD6107668.1 formate/nitrite transporter family protein [Clostridiales bacterium]
MYSPKEVAVNYLGACETKTQLPLLRMFLLACLAGVFVALAGVASTAGAATIENPSVAKVVTGLIFPAGLSMVLIAGSELFTGNNLLIMGVLQRRITVGAMLRNWVVVYLGNFAGSVLIAALAYAGGVFSAFNGELAASVVSIANAKVSLSFSAAFIRGILCNFLVCIAVWMSNAAKTVPGKIMGLFFPIAAFVIAGFEHCVANMYYIPAGILQSGTFGMVYENLTWGGFLLRNLLPVTLGNMVGGVVLVGVTAWYLYLAPERDRVATGK